MLQDSVLILEGDTRTCLINSLDEGCLALLSNHRQKSEIYRACQEEDPSSCFSLANQLGVLDRLPLFFGTDPSVALEVIDYVASKTAEPDLIIRALAASTLSCATDLGQFESIREAFELKRKLAKSLSNLKDELLTDDGLIALKSL